VKAAKGNAPRVAVMGAGAVGCYYGGMLARAGVPVTLIARPAHREAIDAAGLEIDSFRFPSPLRVRVQTAGDASAVSGAAIVLLCVKTLDTVTAACEILPHLAPGALVVSMQNGVDNVERIRAGAGIDALGAAVYVAASMPAAGVVRHSGRGDLIVGRFPGSSAPTGVVEECFNGAGIPCVVAEDIRAPLWRKMIMNCAYNAISALGHAQYGELAARQEIREVMRMVVNEAEAVARAEGVSMPDEDYVQVAWGLAGSMPEARSSTSQDIERGKKTEIDSLNGYVARRAAALGIAAPVNHTLYALVKLLEDAAEGRATL
jgi:2-dehydropantoate 2-reductase